MLLQKLIEDMDVPIRRRHDLRWLSRNLGIRNAQHPNYPEAVKLIVKRIKELEDRLAIAPAAPIVSPDQTETAKQILVDSVWHQEFVGRIRTMTGCSHEQAAEVLGLVLDIRESAYQSGYRAGYRAL